MKVKALQSGKSQKNRRLRLQGIGIDLVSLDRIKKLIQDHGKQTAQKLLTRAEFAKWLRCRNAVLWLAKWFAAKEAFFKAGNSPWLGTDGFRSIEILWRSPNRFEGRIQVSGGRTHQAEGSIFMSREWVGAQVLDWK